MRETSAFPGSSISSRQGIQGRLPVVDVRSTACFGCLVGAPDAVRDAVADLFRVGGEADISCDVAAAVAGADTLVDEAPVGQFVWLIGK